MKFLWSLLLLAPLMYSCDEEDDGVDLLPPSVSSTVDEQNVTEGEEVTLTFNVNAPGGFTSSSVASSNEAIATAAVASDGTVGEQTNSITVTVSGVSIGSAEITLTVEDQQGQERDDDVTITVIDADASGEEPTEAIGTLAAGTEGLDSLVAALTLAELVETLNDEDATYTVFAPNNAAFNAVIEATEGATTVAELVAALNATDPDADPAVAVALLQNHVVAGSAVTSGQLVDGQEIETLGGETITVGVDGTTVTVNGATVVTADVAATNGVVHVIDAVLFTGDAGGEEPTDAIGTLAAGTESLSSLVEALTLAELVETLNDEDATYTVFAPNNAAFDAAIAATDGVTTIEELVAALNATDPDADPSVANTLLLNHVVSGAAVTSDQLTDGQEIETLGGETLTVGIEGDVITVNGAVVGPADVAATNGVVHIIDDVLFADPDPNSEEMMAAGDLIAGTEGLDSLEVGLELAGLVATLNDAEEITVFAPNDAAFIAVLDDTDGATTIEELVVVLGAEAAVELLSNHAIAKNLTASELSDGQQEETLGGGTISFTVADGTVTANGATVTEADLAASNGTVHIVDAVLAFDEEEEEME